MPATPVYTWPYPAGSDSPAGFTEIQSLALAIEATVVSTNAATLATANAAITAAVATLNTTINANYATLVAYNGVQDSNINMAAADTGWITSGFANQSGWNATLYRYRTMMGKFTFLEVDTSRTGSTITSGGLGNISPDIAILSVPAGGQPSYDWVGNYRATTTSGGVELVGGILRILDSHPFSTIETGDQVRVRGAFIHV